MSEFDQLLKQKIDQKKYEYSAKSWQKFTKKAGWKAGLTSLQITAIATISAVVVAVGGFVGYKYLATETQPLPTSPITHVQSSADTTAATTADTIEAVEETMPETSTINPVSNSDNHKEIVNSQLVTTNNNLENVTKIDTIVKQNPVVKRKRYTGGIRKVTIIDLDSIKTNDF